MGHDDLDWRDATSPKQAFAAASDICTFAGGRIVDRLHSRS